LVLTSRTSSLAGLLVAAAVLYLARDVRLPSWLKEDTDHPLIIVASGHPVGCALVDPTPSPHMRSGMDFRMSEFFVLRRHRGRGIGRAAVFALFDRFRGAWAVTEIMCNTLAISFWRRVIGEYTSGKYQEAMSGTEVRQTFDTTRR
jgi:predicted acetyltransferase